MQRATVGEFSDERQRIGDGGCHSQKNAVPIRSGPLQRKVERALFLQKGEIAKDVLLDLLRLGFGIDLLQIQNDLLDGVLAVAAFDDFQTWAVEAQGALGHEQHALVVVFAKAASRGEARAAVRIRRHSNPSRCLVRLKGAGRGPAGIHVGKVKSVKLGPENVALGAQGGVRQRLLLARVGVAYDPGKREFGVFGGLREAAGEIVEAAGEPRVVFAKAVHAKRDEFFREEFRQRGSYRFEVRTCGDKVHVGLNGVSRGGKNAIARECLFTGQTGGFDEAQPFFNAAGSCAVAVVIEDAFAPCETEGGIFAAREDDGVFDGDAALIVVAIERPRLELAACEPAFVHQRVERVLVVVALFTDGVKAGDEGGFRKWWLLKEIVHGWVHSSNSIPS